MFSSDLKFSIIEGAANRLCFNNGTWSSEISTTCCSTVVFDDLLEDVSAQTNTFNVKFNTCTLLMQVNEILAEEITNETQSQVKEIITSLVEATTPPQDQSSLYPQVSTYRFLHFTISHFEELFVFFILLFLFTLCIHFVARLSLLEGICILLYSFLHRI